MSENIVSIFFNILNVVILAGVAWYVYQTRTKKQLEDAMAQSDAAHDALKKAITKSELLFDELNEAAQNQKKYCQSLAQRVQQWQEHEASLVATWRREQEELVKKIHVRHERQQQGLLLHYAQAHLMPTAIAGATQAVAQQFANPKKGEAYIHNAIEHLTQLSAKGHHHGV